jgi:hypothetical protein
MGINWPDGAPQPEYTPDEWEDNPQPDDYGSLGDNDFEADDD